MSRPFAYHTGSQIPGTQKFGNISVGDSIQGYNGNYGGVRWFNGPEEDSGYVIAYARESSQTPGFRRSQAKTDDSFLSLVNSLPERKGQSPFTEGSPAKTWLNANGYWTSWISTTKRVLFLGDTGVNTIASYISSYITGTGNTITYSTVTMGTSYDGAADLSTSNYDVVLMYTNGGQVGSSNLSTNLINYINSGGNVISSVFLWNVYASGFAHSSITPFVKTDSQGHPPGGNIVIVNPTSITNGIGLTMPTFFYNGNPSLVAGATQLATYSNGDNLLAVKTVGSATLVGINAAPININNNTSTICKMFGNSILYV